MKQFEQRLKRIEKILLLKENTIITICYSANGIEPYFKVDGKNFPIPLDVNPDYYIQERLKKINGIVTAICIFTQSNSRPTKKRNNYSCLWQWKIFKNVKGSIN